MVLKVFCVRDQKTEAYMQPFFMKTKGEAIRAWSDTVSDKQTQFNKHPEDFTLFEIGEYNDDNGILIPHQALVSLGNALEFKKE